MNDITEMIFSILSSTQPWQEIFFIGWWLIAYKTSKGRIGVRVFNAGFITSILYVILSQIIIVRNFSMLLSFVSLIAGLYLIISEKGGK